MFKKHTILFTSLALTVLYLVFFISTYGIYDDTNDISYRSALLRGDYTFTPVSNFYIYFIGISTLLSKLFTAFPTTPWVGILLVTLHAFAVFVWFYVMLSLFKEAGLNYWLSIIITTLSVYIFLSESVFYTSIACSSMEGATAGVIFWLFTAYKNQYKIGAAIISLLAIILSVTIQNEVVLVGLCACFIFVLTCGLGKFKPWKIIAALALIYAGLYAYIYLSNDSFKKDFLLNEQYIFTFYDAKYHADSTQLNTVDKAKLEAMNDWFIWDRTQFNQVFFKKVTADKPYNTFSSLAITEKTRQYLHGLKVALLERLLPLLVINVLLFFCGLFFSWENKKRLLAFIAYKAGFWIFFTAVCIVLKYEFRLFNSVFLFDGLLTFVFILWCIKGRVTSSAAPVLLIISLATLIWGCWWTDAYHKRCKTDQDILMQLGQQSRTEVDATFQNKILVPELSAAVALSLSTPLNTEPITRKNKIFGYDCGYTTYYKEFYPQLNQLCGSSNFASVIKYLNTRKDETVFILSPERIKIWKNYLHTVYNMDVDFVLIKRSAPLEGFKNYWTRRGFGYYRLEILN